MILSGKEIAQHMGEDIFIEPFDPRRLNPNSYNLTLHNELLVYENRLLDMKMENPVEQLTIPEEGLVLQPDRLYLGRTQEFTRTENFVPMLEGRSSVGRRRCSSACPPWPSPTSPHSPSPSCPCC